MLQPSSSAVGSAGTQYQPQVLTAVPCPPQPEPGQGEALPDPPPPKAGAELSLVPRDLAGQGCSYKEYPKRGKKPTPKTPTLLSAPRLALSKPSRKPQPWKGQDKGRKCHPTTPKARKSSRATAPLGITVQQQHLVSRQGKCPKQAMGSKEAWQAVTGAEVEEPK